MMARKKPVTRRLLPRKMRGLEEYDRIYGLTRRAHSEARKHGQKTVSRYNDFGRKLQDYAMINNALVKFLGRVKGRRIIHVASSSGIYAKYLQDHGATVIAFDKSKAAASVAAKIGNKNVAIGDARITKRGRKGPGLQMYKSSSFDAFLSDRFLFSGYTHLDRKKSIRLQKKPLLESERILQELHRILKPGGIGIIYAFGPTTPDLEKIEKLGFSVLEIRTHKPGIIDILENIIVLRKNN